MTKTRLDHLLVERGVIATRSQAESWVRLGKVLVDKRVVTKPGTFVASDATVSFKADEQFVSRAGLKLASVAQRLTLDFLNKVVLDVGSSTGGFTDFALRQGAKKVIAVDAGTNQLHASLRAHPKIELHEQTDIRSIRLANSASKAGEVVISRPPDIVVIDVSFISLKEVLPYIARLVTPNTVVVAMLKPQFESAGSLKHKGVIKNETIRRQILKEFEQWVRQYFIIIDKADSEIAGARGNRERFYRLQKTKL